jgi:hypothetical protein
MPFVFSDSEIRGFGDRLEELGDILGQRSTGEAGAPRSSLDLAATPQRWRKISDLNVASSTARQTSRDVGAGGFARLTRRRVKCFADRAQPSLAPFTRSSAARFRRACD